MRIKAARTALMVLCTTCLYYLYVDTKTPAENSSTGPGVPQAGPESLPGKFSPDTTPKKTCTSFHTSGPVRSSEKRSAGFFTKFCFFSQYYHKTIKI